MSVEGFISRRRHLALPLTINIPVKKINIYFVIISHHAAMRHKKDNNSNNNNKNAAIMLVLSLPDAQPNVPIVLGGKTLLQLDKQISHKP